MATTTRAMVGGFGSDLFQVRLRNVDHALRFDERIGFLGRRKNELVVELDSVARGQPGPDRAAAAGVGRRPGQGAGVPDTRC